MRSDQPTVRSWLSAAYLALTAARFCWTSQQQTRGAWLLQMVLKTVPMMSLTLLMIQKLLLVLL